MTGRRLRSWSFIFAAGAIVASAFSSPAVQAQTQAPDPAAAEVTYTKHIAPILQRSCENCHRTGGAAPMALQTYEQVRPWARSIKMRTGIGPRAGVMPPWYVEKDIGIQHFKNDPSLSAEEIALVAKWADSGAPRGNLADMPAARTWNDGSTWSIGTPDLIVKTAEITVKGDAPDWWGEIAPTPTGLAEDRYVAALEVREVNDVPPAGSGRETVGGRYVFHHMIWTTSVLDAPPPTANPEDPFNLAALFGQTPGTTIWPVHEVGRGADFFDPKSARLITAGSSVVSDSVHLHSNGRDTKSHLEIGFKFMPKGYKPEYRSSNISLGNGVDIDIRAMDSNQQLNAYAVLTAHTKILSFEPHLHAPGSRMCLEASWGYTVETINCVGYDHNWVRGYDYDDDHAPLLPKGTVLHIVGYMNNSPSNKNVPDPRNWQGSGNRSVANMFIDLGNRVSLTDEQFLAEMKARQERLNLTRNSVMIGCPFCSLDLPDKIPAPPAPAPARTPPRQQQR
ncbi:MAG TPA: hypothetical protein VMW48_18640 [Vicinamibacterales bacterium]|nr:hypothetical protein [Vicinamibacterales bacterium]